MGWWTIANDWLWQHLGQHLGQRWQQWRRQCDTIDTPGGEGGDATPRANGLRFYSPLHERLTLATVARDLSGGMVDASR